MGNSAPANLQMVFAVIWNALNYTFYFGSQPFTLWEVAMCGPIVGVFAVFLKNIVFFWRGRKE